MMCEIWKYLTNHIRQDFHPGLYSTLAIFLAICISLNYHFDFEDSFIDLQTGYRKYVFFFLTHSFMYLIPVLIIKAFRSKDIKLSAKFWLVSLVAIILLSAQRSMVYFDTNFYYLVNTEIFVWGLKVLKNVLGVFYTIIPVYFLYRLTDKEAGYFYGFTKLPEDLKPYLILLLIMVPILISASFLPGFQKQYPMYTSTQAHIFLNVPEAITVGIYELAYALNFVTLEFFFRGFLVLGIVAYLGKAALLPMACLYCSIHFGKPMPEAISSIIGGYILGIISLETKSIWGGALVHIGIAWMMEIAAFVIKSN
ncbi:MAG: CPBP family intramembrane metalloprotease [Cyclobacteriaceae bacterium]|nr:CPBP family intramembrane metalloprotease [Cyclobacteriaceae bacterium]